MHLKSVAGLTLFYFYTSNAQMNRIPLPSKLNRTLFAEVVWGGVSLVLVSFILLLTFARVSPELHAWLHGVSGEVVVCGTSGHNHSHNDDSDTKAPKASDAHFCGVLALQLGCGEFSLFSTGYEPHLSEYVLIELGRTLCFDRFISAAQPRAPPIEIIV